MGALNDFHKANWQAMWTKLGRSAPLSPVFAALLCMPPIGELATAVLEIEAKTNVDEERAQLLRTIVHTMKCLSLLAASVGCEDLEALVFSTEAVPTPADTDGE